MGTFTFHCTIGEVANGALTHTREFSKAKWIMANTSSTNQVYETDAMSDAEWEEYIDSLIAAHKEGRCNPKTCAQCLQPGDPLDWWLS